jgi:hypothetical protein
LSQLGAVLVGAVIALISSWGGRAIDNFWDRKKRRSDKFADLVSAVYDTDHWLDRKQTFRVFGLGLEPVDASPLGKAQTIATVYFTRLTKDLDTFGSAVRTHEMWQLENRRKRLANPAAFAPEGHTEAYNQYLLALNALLKRLSDYARQEFQ